MKLVVQVIRKPVVKVLTRAILYGLMALFAALSVETYADEAAPVAEALAEGVFAVGCLIAGALIARWHHRKDRAEPATPAT